MAVRTENDEILDIIVRALAIDVANFQNIFNAEAAMCADLRIMLERQLAVIHAVDLEWTTSPVLLIKRFHCAELSAWIM